MVHGGLFIYPYSIINTSSELRIRWMEVCEAEGEKKLTFTEHLLGSRHCAGIFHPQWVFAVFVAPRPLLNTLLHESFTSW